MVLCDMKMYSHGSPYGVLVHDSGEQWGEVVLDNVFTWNNQWYFMCSCGPNCGVVVLENGHTCGLRVGT